MAEIAGEKNFDATPHRRQEAREKGQVAFSQDLSSAAMLLLALLLLRWVGANVWQFSARLMEFQLGEHRSLVADRDTILAESFRAVWGASLVMLPLLGLLFVAGVMTNVLQIGFLFVPERVAPDWGRLNPLKGLQRIFSLAGVMKLGFGMFKIVIILAVSALLLWSKREAVLYCGSLELEQLGIFLLELTLDTALWVAGALFALALLDYGFQRWKYDQGLKMTHQEIKEEMKNLQGDPQLVARRRKVQRQLVNHPLMTAVLKADVIVTDPMELAVAIQYESDQMAAPIVLAKGAGLLAEQIHKLAMESNIPIVERKPLAQLLYKEVAVNHPIPDKAYATVAEILAYGN